MTSTHDLQIALEQRSVTLGYERYTRQQERLKEDQGYSATSVVLKVIKGAIPLVSQEIERYLKSVSRGGKGKSPVALGYLKELDVHLLAHLSLSCVFNSVARERTVSQCSMEIGRFVENELWAMALRGHDKALFERLVDRAMKAHGNVAYRRKAVRATASTAGFKYETLPNDTRVKIGEPLLNAVLVSLSDVFEIVQFGDDNRVAITEQGRVYLQELTELEAWMRPAFQPMVIPPKPWTHFNTGCYYTDALSRHVSIVRTSSKEQRQMVKEAINSGIMQPCLEALNTIQNTAWAINKPMLGVVEWAWEQGVALDSFPPRHYLTKPPRPDNWETLSEDRKKAWRIKASKVAERNRGIDGEKVVMLQDLTTAQELSALEAFWIPHNLDFRGRVYPICHFSQQRSDHIKALLRFSKGLPIGSDGAYWLAVHLANCGDFGKVSKRPLDERVRWVQENEDLIVKVARDPKGTFDIWKAADAPFQFVAACIEWLGVLEEGEKFVSHLPVALDGSNSGLQHYSAALRSPEGALVNLTPSLVPSDVYQVVCDHVKAMVERDASNGDALAKVVLKNGVTRKLVKRSTMTYAYSSEQFGFAQQLRDDLMKPLSLEVLEGRLESHPYGDDHGFRASLYIAKCIWIAVTTIVKDANEGMKFFQKCAAVLAHERKGLSWVSPVGLPVLHKYTEYETKRVEMFLYDKKVTVSEASPKDKVAEETVLKRIRANIRTKPTQTINKSKAKSAVAPNIIHAQDASHLMLTVLEAREVGISDFALIHDSFGTHAANTTAFFRIIRETFVDLYKNYDPFEEIYYQTKKALDDKGKIPEPPAKGTLDIEGVIDSLYAFA